MKSRLKKQITSGIRSTSVKRKQIQQIIQARQMRLHEIVNISPNKLLVTSRIVPAVYSICLNERYQYPIEILISSSMSSIHINPSSIVLGPGDVGIPKHIFLNLSESSVQEDESGSITVAHRIRHAEQEEILCTKQIPVYLLKRNGDMAFACGSNEACELGTDSSAKKFEWKGELQSEDPGLEEVQNSQKCIFSSVSIGKYHTLMSDEKGRAWAVGYGGQGQLGVPLFNIVNLQNSYNSEKQYLNDEDLPSNYTFDGQQDNLNFWKSSKFTPIAFRLLHCPFVSCQILKVACGFSHSLFLTEHRQVFSCGNFLNGRLGLGKAVNKNVTAPTLVKTLVGKNITDLAAGRDFSLAISSAGKLYSWGSSRKGCLGIAHSSNDEFDPVLLPTGEMFSAVFAGSEHCAALSSNCRLYMWGCNADGKLGIKSPSESKIIETPQLLPTLFNRCVIAVALGKNHSLALSNKLEVFSWGSNERGQLGLFLLNCYY